MNNMNSFFPVVELIGSSILELFFEIKKSNAKNGNKK